MATVNGDVFELVDTQIRPAVGLDEPGRTRFDIPLEWMNKICDECNNGKRTGYVKYAHKETGAVGQFEKLWMGRNMVDPSDKRPWLHGSARSYSQDDIGERCARAVKGWLKSETPPFISGSFTYRFDHPDDQVFQDVYFEEASFVEIPAVQNAKLIRVRSGENSNGQPSYQQDFPGFLLSIISKNTSEKMATPTNTPASTLPAIDTDDDLSKFPESYQKALVAASNLQFTPTAEESAELSRLLIKDATGAEATQALLLMSTDFAAKQRALYETSQTELEMHRKKQQDELEARRKDNEPSVNQMLELFGANLNEEQKKKAAEMVSDLSVMPSGKVLWEMFRNAQTNLTQKDTELQNTSKQLKQATTNARTLAKSVNAPQPAAPQQNATTAANTAAPGKRTPAVKPPTTGEVSKKITGGSVTDPAIANSLAVPQMVTVESSGGRIDTVQFPQLFPDSIQYSDHPEVADFQLWLLDPTKKNFLSNFNCPVPTGKNNNRVAQWN